jgi:hypothetical protein
MSGGSGSTPGEREDRPPEDAAEDQSTNELGFRDVDEEADHDESPGGQGSGPSPGSGSGSGEDSA